MIALPEVAVQAVFLVGHPPNDRPTMLPGLRQLREARAHVDACGPGLPRDELSAAFRCVWQASTRWTDWPLDLHRRAEELFETCFRHGGIDASVARLTDDEARTAAGSIRRLLDKAETYELPLGPR